MVDGEAVVGVETDRGRFDAPVVVDVAGAWAAGLARTVGVEVPVDTWRHDTAFFGLPAGRGPDFPIVIDEMNQVYFRPEGRDLMLVGLEGGNEVGGSPDRPFPATAPGLLEDMVKRLCVRVPWMADGTFRTAHGGQDGITTADQRPDPRPGRAGRVLPGLRVLGDGLQDRAGHRPLPHRAHPRRSRDDGRHRRLLAGSVCRRSPARR